MMDIIKNNILYYLKDNKFISVPILQREFDLSYSDARNVLAELEKSGAIKFCGGVEYCLANDPAQAPQEERKEGRSAKDIFGTFGRFNFDGSRNVEDGDMHSGERHDGEADDMSVLDRLFRAASESQSNDNNDDDDDYFVDTDNGDEDYGLDDDTFDDDGSDDDTFDDDDRFIRASDAFLDDEDDDDDPLDYIGIAMQSGPSVQFDDPYDVGLGFLGEKLKRVPARDKLYAVKISSDFLDIIRKPRRNMSMGEMDVIEAEFAGCMRVVPPIEEKDDYPKCIMNSDIWLPNGKDFNPYLLACNDGSYLMCLDIIIDDKWRKKLAKSRDFFLVLKRHRTYFNGEYTLLKTAPNRLGLIAAAIELYGAACETLLLMH